MHYHPARLTLDAGTVTVSFINFWGSLYGFNMVNDATKGA
jgi:hypothetical protein